MNFIKTYDTYDENAHIQKIVAQNLLTFLQEKECQKNFNKVFEIGCGTGIFTRLFLKNYFPTSTILNDIFDTKKYIKDISYQDFLIGNVENIPIPNSDIIISSSVFQWIQNFPSFIEKLSHKTDKLIFSIYIQGNLLEIDRHFDISLNYMTPYEIYEILKKHFKNISYKEEVFVKNFKTPFEALKHLKHTGVTGFKKSSIKKVRSFSENSLTYKVAYFYCTK